MKGPIAMITGATSGFGEATAKRLAKEGWNLILTGRRVDRLEKLAKSLSKKYDVHILTQGYDVRIEEAVIESVASLNGGWEKIDVLINNAGLAVGRSPINDGDSDDWNRMIDTNVKGLLYVTRAVSNLMKIRKKGHIVNIGSIAGKEVYDGGNVYCASKFAVDALTKAMRIELLPLGIKVTQIAPGAAETEFSLVRFKDDKEKASAVYNGFTPLSADDIADTVHYAITRPKHVCLNDIVIMPTAQANSTTIFRNV
jgi:3-hydroxy acid dehydrogenase / malonic semialdehyde reductase